MQTDIAHAHRKSRSQVMAMNVAELEYLRHLWVIEKGDLCQAANIAPSTYARWMRWLRNERGASQPQERTVQEVRAAMVRLGGKKGLVDDGQAAA